MESNHQHTYLLGDESSNLSDSNVELEENSSRSKSSSSSTESETEAVALDKNLKISQKNFYNFNVAHIDLDHGENIMLAEVTSSQSCTQVKKEDQEKGNKTDLEDLSEFIDQYKAKYCDKKIEPLHIVTVEDVDETDNECESIQFDETSEKHQEIIDHYLKASYSDDKFGMRTWQAKFWSVFCTIINAIIDGLIVFFSSKNCWNTCSTIANVLLSMFVYVVLGVAAIMIAIIIHFHEDTRPQRRRMRVPKREWSPLRVKDINEILNMKISTEILTENLSSEELNGKVSSDILKRKLSNELLSMKVLDEILNEKLPEKNSEIGIQKNSEMTE